MLLSSNAPSYMQHESYIMRVFEGNWVHTDEIPVKKLLEEESLTPDLIDSDGYFLHKMAYIYMIVLSYALLCLMTKLFAYAIEIS